MLEEVSSMVMRCVNPHPGAEGQRWLQGRGVAVEAELVPELCDGHFGGAVVSHT